MFYPLIRTIRCCSKGVRTPWDLVYCDIIYTEKDLSDDHEVYLTSLLNIMIGLLSVVVEFNSKDLEVIYTYTYVTALMIFITIKSTNICRCAVGVDSHLIT